MPVGVAAAARAIAAPRTVDEAQGLVVGQHAGDRRRGELADRVTGGRAEQRLGRERERCVGVEVEDGPQAGQRRGDQQGLRDGRVADRVRVGRGAVGDQVEAGRAGRPRDRLGDGRQLEPRGEHAGGLGALTGADDDEHVLHSCLPGAAGPRSRRAPTFSDALVRLLQRVLLRRSGRRVEPAERERGLQDVRLAGVQRVPAGHVGDAPQAVADRVRVHVERARRSLERASRAEVGRERLQQRPLAGGERRVRLGDERPARRLVADEHAFGQQLVGLHRTRRLLPGGRGEQPGQRGAGRPGRVA